MLKKISLLIGICFYSWMLPAQETLSSKQMVAITPMLSYSIDLPQDARNSLSNKLTQMVTQNGFGSASGQFVLTSNIVVIDKQVTATAPAQFVVKLEASFFVVDVMEQVIIDEMSLELQGVDRHENKAVIQAINQIKPKSPSVRTFMNGCRSKIIDYYNTRIPTLLTKAQSLADRNEYDEALYVLACIPEDVDQYPVVAEQMAVIYKKKIDREAAAAIQEAQAKMAVKDYEGAAEALATVDPTSNNASKAASAIATLRQTVDEKDRAKLELQLKRYDDAREAAKRAQDDKVMLTKMYIQAAQKVGVESAKTETSLASSLNKWFLGKFK